MIGHLKIFNSSQQFLFEIPIQNLPFSLKFSDYQIQIFEKNTEYILTYNGEQNYEFNLSTNPIATTLTHVFHFFPEGASQPSLTLQEDVSKSVIIPKKVISVGMDLQPKEETQSEITHLTLPKFDTGADVQSEHPLLTQKNLGINKKTSRFPLPSNQQGSNPPSKSKVRISSIQSAPSKVKYFIYSVIAIIFVTLSWFIQLSTTNTPVPKEWEPTNQSTNFQLKAKWMETVIEKIPASEAEKEIERLFRTTEF